MSDNSKIEWCDATWNPVTGCTPVSAGCANCYAKRMVKRFPHLHGIEHGSDIGGDLNPSDVPVPFSTVRFHPSRLDIPIRWKKPRRIFVCSIGDLFHEDVTDSQILSVWTAMGEFYDAKGTMQPSSKRPGHTYMVLTKRPERMRDFLKSRYPEHFQRPNVWLGVTAENQETADQRIPILLQTPAAKRFVSIEPMLSAVDLKQYLTGHEENGVDPEMKRPVGCCLSYTPPLDWAIVGGETGPGARFMHPHWVENLRDQCTEADVPFFFKGWGTKIMKKSDPNYMKIDGREWKEFPT